MTWLLFGALAVAILWAGTSLTKRAGMIADRTGAGRTWIGLVLLATTTSLPELFTGTGAAALYQAPDIAVGNALGGNVVTLLFIVLVDARRGRATPFPRRQRPQYVLAITAGVVLLTLVGAGLVLGRYLPPAGWMGLTTLFILPAYLLTMRLLHGASKKEPAEDADTVPIASLVDITLHPSLRRLYVQYATYAAVVIVAALFLPGIGEALAAETGLAQTTIASLTLSVATSLPELAVTFAAMRTGQAGLALGNIFGSNLFNLSILAWDDALYTPGPLLSAASTDHLFTVSATLAMYAVIMLWMAAPIMRRRWLRLSLGSWALLAIYAFLATVMTTEV